MKPRRIQLKRTRGWRMPENTVKVDRTTKWGNPFTMQFCQDWFELGPKAARAKSVDMFERWIRGQLDDSWVAKERPTDFGRIRNKNLACWCPLDQPCHADVLLELANTGADK